MTSPDLTAVLTWLNDLRLSQPEELHRRLTNLEEHMASTDDKITELKSVLNNIQGDVSRLAADLQAARDEIAAQDPALAAKLDPVLEQARAIDAATPELAPTEPTA